MTDPEILPASLTQRRLWLLDQLNPGRSTYDIRWDVELHGRLDLAALNAALTVLVARHESLRTHFTAVDGEPAQVVAPAYAVELVPASGPAAPYEPFDLSTGPLARFTLARRGPEEHVLTIVVHHAVADGWSFGILFAELADAYAGKALPEVALQYADFAVWQREQDRQGAFDADLDHWQSVLSGAPDLLDLPADRPRPAEQTDAGAEVTFAVPAELTRRLREAPDGTLFTRMLAGYQTLLHRLTGRDDLLVAIPVAARTRPQTRDVVGFFANTCVLRATFPAGVTFARVAAAARTSVTDAQIRQDAPFEQIVDRLGATRSLAYAPLVQVMFAVDEPPPVRTAAGVRFVPMLRENGTVKFDLTLTVEDRPDGLRGRVTYRTDLFDAARVHQFVARYLTLLSAALDRPHAAVDDLPVADAGEDERRERRGTGERVPLPADTVTELLHRLPWRDPEAVAVSGPDGTLTYRVLHERANRLAHLLRERGAGPDVPVGLRLTRGVGMIAAILAVWKAGAGYLPLDPALPAARLDDMLADARPPVVLTDDSEVDLSAYPAAPPDVVTHPEALAYLLYTSGSTGRPKGVAVPHRAVADLLTGFDRVLGLTPADRVAAVTTPAFDISVVELVLPLLAGARIEVLDAETTRDAARLRTELAARRVTVAQGTPATWRMLVTAGGVPDGVRLRISGGEALPRDLADRLTEGGHVLLNGYGPSETTVYSTAGPVVPGTPVGLGRPTPNTHLRLLDTAGRPVLDGATGEISIGGPGVARGYHGAAAATAARFRPDPSAPGARRYATGDLARWLPDGTLAYLGRADTQIKVRGFRIEPGEIETLLRQRPEIRDAVVVARAHGDADVRLVAYVVADDPVSWPRVRDGLAARLPDYMVPATLVVLDTLPRTGSGKVDRAALPEPDWRGSAEPVTAARTPAEKALAELWQDVLRLPEVDVHDNFFALGGHSLTATRLIARIRAELGADVTLRDLFAAPTVAQLAAGLTEAVPMTSDLRTSRPRPAPDRPVSLDDLSDSEIDDLLDQLISEEGL